MENKKEEISAKEINYAQNNPNYLKQVQKFYDIVDNIDNEDLKKDIINQMLKCGDSLTKSIQENRKRNE